ncbi:hypothetical protein, partial [Clostridium sp.]|uniref:hypothetical protein n=1 Tax=Clostridium sp. TaxID=1506 RepID=UPI002632C7BA
CSSNGETSEAYYQFLALCNLFFTGTIIVPVKKRLTTYGAVRNGIRESIKREEQSLYVVFVIFNLCSFLYPKLIKC